MIQILTITNYRTSVDYMTVPEFIVFIANLIANSDYNHTIKYEYNNEHYQIHI